MTSNPFLHFTHCFPACWKLPMLPKPTRSWLGLMTVYINDPPGVIQPTGSTAVATVWMNVYVASPKNLGCWRWGKNKGRIIPIDLLRRDYIVLTNDHYFLMVILVQFRQLFLSIQSRFLAKQISIKHCYVTLMFYKSSGFTTQVAAKELGSALTAHLREKGKHQQSAGEHVLFRENPH